MCKNFFTEERDVVVGFKQGDQISVMNLRKICSWQILHLFSSAASLQQMFVEWILLNKTTYMYLFMAAAELSIFFIFLCKFRNSL
jgi:hypothetical protein